MELVGQHLIWSMVWSLLLAGVPLIIAAGIGLLIAILQAATQIQDQTLPQTVKLFAIAFILLALGGVLSAPLIGQAKSILDDLPRIAGSN